MNNPFYSLSDDRVFDTNDRYRVARQILSVLKDYYGGERLKHACALDVGCSGGAITYYLGSVVRSIIGVDVDENAINLAKKNFKRKNLLYKNVHGRTLPFTDSSFDIVICNEVYSYVDNAHALIGEIFRVLKSGGCCYFSGGNGLFPIESRYKIPFLHYLPDNLASRLFWLIKRKQYYVAHYKTLWELTRLLRKFHLTDYTTSVIQEPRRYSFTKLFAVEKITRRLPIVILRVLEPFVPTFIFVLSK